MKIYVLPQIQMKRIKTYNNGCNKEDDVGNNKISIRVHMEQQKLAIGPMYLSP